MKKLFLMLLLCTIQIFGAWSSDKPLAALRKKNKELTEARAGLAKADELLAQEQERVKEQESREERRLYYGQRDASQDRSCLLTDKECDACSEYCCKCWKANVKTCFCCSLLLLQAANTAYMNKQRIAYEYISYRRYNGYLLDLMEYARLEDVKFVDASSELLCCCYTFCYWLAYAQGKAFDEEYEAVKAREELRLKQIRNSEMLRD